MDAISDIGKSNQINNTNELPKRKRLEKKQQEDSDTRVKYVSTERPAKTAAKEKAEETVESFPGIAKNPSSREDMAEAIDGKKKEERTGAQAHAVDNTIDGTVDDIEQDVSVISVDVGVETVAVTETGIGIDVTLEKGEKSKVVEASDGEKIVVVASDLSAKEAEDAALDAVGDLIEENAEENGVQMKPDFRRRFKRVVRRSLNTSIDRVVGPQLIQDMIIDMLTTDDDERRHAK